MCVCVCGSVTRLACSKQVEEFKRSNPALWNEGSLIISSLEYSYSGQLRKAIPKIDCRIDPGQVCFCARYAVPVFPLLVADNGESKNARTLQRARFFSRWFLTWGGPIAAACRMSLPAWVAQVVVLKGGGAVGKRCLLRLLARHFNPGHGFIHYPNGWRASAL